MTHELADLLDRATRGLVLDEHAPDDAIHGYRRQRRRLRAAAGATAAIAIAAAVAIPVLVESPSADTQRLVPAAPPSDVPAQKVLGLAAPIVPADTHLRLDPAGEPPASTASYQSLLAAAQSLPGKQTTQVFYGLFTDDDAGYYPSKKLGVGPMIKSFDRRPVVWVVHASADGKVTAYTALDPTTAWPLISWTLGARMPFSETSGHR
jgi:hypothetical protein